MAQNSSVVAWELEGGNRKKEVWRGRKEVGDGQSET